MKPGEYFIADGEIELNPGRDRVRLRVENVGDRPIQVGSHTHFFEVNRFLRFDRATAYGRRLDIPAGTALRFEPGEGREVHVIPLGGKRLAYGMSGLTDGPLDERGEQVLIEAQRRGFMKESR
jgi:urease beta subunit